MSGSVIDEQDVTEAVIATEMGAPYEEAKAHQAWKTAESDARALSASDIGVINANPASAAFQAMKVYRAASEQGVFARFSRLPPEEFDIGHVGRQKTYGWALLYVQRKATGESMRSSSAQVPPKIVSAALELRRGMIKVVDYHLGDDPVIANELTGIRAGSGHVDTANDLAELADLYETHYALLSLDKRHFRAQDTAEARRLSDAIYDHLGRSAEIREWLEARNRVFALLKRSHAEVLAAASFLFRNEPHQLARFPSLYTAPAKPKPFSPAEPPSAPAEPSPA